MEENSKYLTSFWLLYLCMVSLYWSYALSMILFWPWQHGKECLWLCLPDLCLLGLIIVSENHSISMCEMWEGNPITLKFMVSFYSVSPYWREFAVLSREALKVSFRNTMLFDFSSLLYSFLQIWQDRPSWLCHPLFPHLSEPDAESQDTSDLFSEFFPGLPASPSCFTAVSASLISVFNLYIQFFSNQFIGQFLICCNAEAGWQRTECLMCMSFIISACAYWGE